MGAQGNVSWDQLCEVWNDCSSQRVWNCFAEIMTQAGGGHEDMDWLHRNSLSNDDRNTIISLYVEVFKDHLTTQERRLLETAGIKLVYIDKAEVNEAIQVVLKNKNIVTETIGKPKHEEVAQIKTVSLKELMNILKVK
jgi:hypothetical protein